MSTRVYKLKITQQELAEKVGTARSYIARALGIEFTPTFL
nr:helix-turn-helix domain-containing protein [Bacteroides sp.]